MRNKSQSKKLSDVACRDLPRLDKIYFKPGDYPGLQFWVWPSGKKTWKFQYYDKNKKYQTRKSIGSYPVVGVQEATRRAKEIDTKIFKGIDPKEQSKSDVLNMQLGEAIRKYYLSDLTTTNQHRATTIKNIKAIFKVWIFRDTYDKDILNILTRAEDLQYKKISSITPKMFKELFHLCGSRSPIVANRLQNYLRKFWNDFVKENNCPFILKKKFMYVEKIYLDFLDPTELQRVMKVFVQIDNRTGRLNYDYYKRSRLSPVACLLLAFLFTTGRRTEEASSLTWEQFTRGDNPRITLKKTKTSSRNQKLVFNLGEEAVKVLNLISLDRLNNKSSAFYYPIDDIRNEYIFPSKHYGKKFIGGSCKSAYLIDPGKTFEAVLLKSGITRHLKVYATRHTFATNFYKQTRDIKALADALGTTEEIAVKYAKLVGETVVDGINKIKFYNNDTPVFKQVN